MSEARDLLLKAATHLSVLTGGSHPVIAEIKEYLEKPEQEPVAWIDRINFNSLPDKAWVLQCYVQNKKTDRANIPLYAEPPERKPFTEDRIHEIMDKKVDDASNYGFNTRAWFKLGFKEAEKRHGIRK